MKYLDYELDSDLLSVHTLTAGDRSPPGFVTRSLPGQGSFDPEGSAVAAGGRYGREAELGVPAPVGVVFRAMGSWVGSRGAGAPLAPGESQTG